jgi:hypothetical protein
MRSRRLDPQDDSQFEPTRLPQAVPIHEKPTLADSPWLRVVLSIMLGLIGALVLAIATLAYDLAQLERRVERLGPLPSGQLRRLP